MDNKDTNQAKRPHEQKYIVAYPCGFKIVDRTISRYDNMTNRQERVIQTRDFRERRHGQ